jgi:hypothetical protein
MENDDYEIGYGKPPKAGRFKKGASGNPAGRPKGVKNMRTLFLIIMREKVTVIEGGKQKAISRLEAILRQLSNKAMSGDLRAMREVLRSSTLLDESESAMPDSLEEKARDKELIDSFLKQVQHWPCPAAGALEQPYEPEAKGGRDAKPINVFAADDDDQ